MYPVTVSLSAVSVRLGAVSLCLLVLSLGAVSLCLLVLLLTLVCTDYCSCVRLCYCSLLCARATVHSYVCMYRLLLTLLLLLLSLHFSFDGVAVEFASARVSQQLIPKVHVVILDFGRLSHHSYQ